MTAPDQTVPDELFGCWQRQWIEFADGSRDDTSFVVWLQLPSLMADVRLSPAALALAGRTSLSLSDLMVLAQSDSSSGATVCTPVVEGTAVAEWSTAIGFQPVSAFPESGVLEWNSDGTVMMERAPSGVHPRTAPISSPPSTASSRSADSLATRGSSSIQQSPPESAPFFFPERPAFTDCS